MERNSFVFYRSFFESTTELDDESRLVIYDALLNYALNGISPELKGALKTIFLLIKPQIDANNKKFIDGHKGAEYGQKGGRPPKEKTPQKPQENPTITPPEPPMRNEKGEMRNEKGEMRNDDNKDILVIQGAVEIYNTLAENHGLTKVLKLTPQRKTALKLRLKECGGINGWQNVIDKIAESDFLVGKNNKGWRADFDFILKPRNFTKIIEGGYENRKKPNSIEAQMEDILKNGW